MKIEMTMKEKRFSFFADLQIRKAVCWHTLHTFANRTKSTHRPKFAKECNSTMPITLYLHL